MKMSMETKDVNGKEAAYQKWCAFSFFSTGS